MGMYIIELMKYVMLLRGMGPGDPEFNNQSICQCLEKLGYGNVSSLQASGNYLFETDESGIAKLEADIEDAIELRVGYRRAAVVRSAVQIGELMKLDPFRGMTHGPSSYLLVTFMKRATKPTFTTPYHPEGKPYEVLAYKDGMIFTTTNNTIVKTTDLMTWLEKQFSKDVTSRTWNTMQRVHKRLEAS